MSHKISLILKDRESGSVALLKHLIKALEEEFHDPDMNAGKFRDLLITIRKELKHFAAIENFLESLITHTGQEHNFPGDALRFIAEYRSYWKDSAGEIAENFLRSCNPKGLTMLTHSHSETIIALLDRMHARQIPFRVLQTLSSPGEEGKLSHERMLQRKIQADLIDDRNMQEALTHTDLILLGCDALLPAEFLNKTGTRAILQQAKQLNIPSCLVTESRKEITRPDWNTELRDHPLFEWTSLDLVDRIVTER